MKDLYNFYVEIRRIVQDRITEINKIQELNCIDDKPHINLLGLYAHEEHSLKDLFIQIDNKFSNTVAMYNIENFEFQQPIQIDKLRVFITEISNNINKNIFVVNDSILKSADYNHERFLQFTNLFEQELKNQNKILGIVELLVKEKKNGG